MINKLFNILFLLKNKYEKKIKNLFIDTSIFVFNLYKYLCYKKIVYKMKIDNNLYEVLQIYNIYYDNIINNFIFNGKVLLITDKNNNNIDLNKFLENDKIDKLLIKCKTNDNIYIDLVLENDLATLVGRNFYLNILNNCSIDSNIYLLIYYYIRRYLECNIKIESVKLNYYDNNNLYHSKILDNKLKLRDLNFNK